VSEKLVWCCTGLVTLICCSELYDIVSKLCWVVGGISVESLFCAETDWTVWAISSSKFFICDSTLDDNVNDDELTGWVPNELNDCPPYVLTGDVPKESN
jgi:hypothetical protein